MKLIDDESADILVIVIGATILSFVFWCPVVWLFSKVPPQPAVLNSHDTLDNARQLPDAPCRPVPRD